MKKRIVARRGGTLLGDEAALDAVLRRAARDRLFLTRAIAELQALEIPKSVTRAARKAEVLAAYEALRRAKPTMSDSWLQRRIARHFGMSLATLRDYVYRPARDWKAERAKNLHHRKTL